MNVHWHIGAEHYSKGEYDENGSGPIDFHEGRQGFQCSFYDKDDPAFNAPQYPWKHCIGMTVGQTYEVHWPHSAAGTLLPVVRLPYLHHFQACATQSGSIRLLSMMVFFAVTRSSLTQPNRLEFSRKLLLLLPMKPTIIPICSLVWYVCSSIVWI